MSTNITSININGRDYVIDNIHIKAQHDHGIDCVVADIHLPLGVIRYEEWFEEGELSESMLMLSPHRSGDPNAKKLSSFAAAELETNDLSELILIINAALLTSVEQNPITESDAIAQLEHMGETGFTLRRAGNMFAVYRLDDEGNAESWVGKAMTPRQALRIAREEVENERLRQKRRNLHPDVQRFNEAIYRLGITKKHFSERIGYTPTAISKMLAANKIPKWVWLVFAGLEYEKIKG